MASVFARRSLRKASASVSSQAEGSASPTSASGAAPGIPRSLSIGSGAAPGVGANARIVREGNLVKRAIVSGRNWKTRYFVLREDGSLSFMATKSDPPKKTMYLGPRSKALVSPDSPEEFSVEGPSHDSLYLRADSAAEAKSWLDEINICIKKKTEAEDARRAGHLEGYAATSKSRLLFGRKSGTNKTKDKPLSPKESTKEVKLGWEMKVGDKDGCFVEAKTLNYYESREAFMDASAPLGKANLSMLV